MQSTRAGAGAGAGAAARRGGPSRIAGTAGRRSSVPPHLPDTTSVHCCTPISQVGRWHKTLQRTERPCALRRHAAVGPTAVPRAGGFKATHGMR